MLPNVCLVGTSLAVQWLDFTLPLTAGGCGFHPICHVTWQKKKRLKRCIWTLWEKARVGWSERIALKYVYYQGWNRSPVQVGCVRQVLRAGALGWPRGMGWGGRWAGGSGWETPVNPWLIHVNVWQKPLQYCKVISLQLIKIKEKKRSVFGYLYFIY